MTLSADATSALGRWTLGALACGITLLCLPNSFYYRDALWNALRIAHEPYEALVHPHHPGYLIALKALWQLTGGANGTEGALLTLTLFSRLGAIALLLAWTAFLRQIPWEDHWRGLSVLTLSLAFAFWEFGTNGAIYCPTIALLLLVIALLYRWDAAGPTSPEAWRAGLWLGLAFAIHQLVLLFLPGLCWWTWTAARKAGWTFPKALTHLAWPLLAPILVFYVIAIGYFLVLDGPAGIGTFARWATEYGHTSGYWWWMTVPEGVSPLTYFAKLFISGHFRLFLGYSSVETAGVAGGMGDAMPGSLKALLALIGLAAGTLLAVGAVRYWRADASLHALARLVVLIYAPLWLFLCAFEIHSNFYRLYFVMWIWLLILATLRWAAGAMRHGQPVVCASLMLVLGGSLLVNFRVGYLPRLRVADNQFLAAIPALQVTGNQPLLFRSGKNDHLTAVYAAVFTRRPVLLVRPPEEVPDAAPDPGQHQAIEGWYSTPPGDEDWSGVIPGYYWNLRNGELGGQLHRLDLAPERSIVVPPYYFTYAFAPDPALQAP